jgi:transposase
MWTTGNRPRYDRDTLRYPSDLTDDEWTGIGPMIPPAKRGGRRRDVDIRAVLTGVMYVLSTGCGWRYVPSDLPPRSTLHGYFQRWDYDGTLKKIHHRLYQKCRQQAEQGQPDRLHHRQPEREERRKRGIRIDPKGYDAGKKISGKKRPIAVDTQGLLMHAGVHPADIQDRDGGILVMGSMFALYPFVTKLFADAGYQGPSSARRWPRRCPGCPSRSSNAPT